MGFARVDRLVSGILYPIRALFVVERTERSSALFRPCSQIGCPKLQKFACTKSSLFLGVKMKQCSRVNSENQTFQPFQRSVVAHRVWR